MSDEPETYRGENITLHFDGHKCVHSRRCVLGLPDVFVANADGPWIRPDNASAEALAALARRCPSGAITYTRHDAGEAEAPPPVNTARLFENGPVAFTAELSIAGQPAGIRATLCRCGASGNKPYCDGSHTGAGFHATGEPATEASSPLEQRGGLLKVMPLKNGPLLVEGNLEIIAGTGRTLNRTRKTALCRCGASARKPYCDGTHGKIGFTAG